MRLVLLHPTVAQRSCRDCQTYLYLDRGPGDFAPEPMERGGKLVRRPPKTRPPCHWCPKIPPGAEPVPANAIEYTPAVAAAYQHYLECKATGQFPADAIARQNAALIRSAEELAEQVRNMKLAALRGG